MTEQTLPARPEYPQPPVIATPPQLDIPKRGIWSGIAGAIGGVTSFLAWTMAVTYVGSLPGADFTDGVNTATGAFGWAAIVGYLVYKVLTLPYAIRERRVERQHKAALDAWKRVVDEDRATHAAAVEKYNADVTTWHQADDKAFRARLGLDPADA